MPYCVMNQNESALAWANVLPKCSSDVAIPEVETSRKLVQDSSLSADKEGGTPCPRKLLS